MFLDCMRMPGDGSAVSCHTDSLANRSLAYLLLRFLCQFRVQLVCSASFGSHERVMEILRILRMRFYSLGWRLHILYATFYDLYI